MGGNEERETGTGPELYLKTDKVGRPCEREWAQAWVERNSLSLLLSLNWSGLALAGVVVTYLFAQRCGYRQVFST
jgi:hypothetical protein